MNTQLSSKEQIVLPVELREADHLVAGQIFEIERVAAGEYLLKRVPELRRRGHAMPIKDSLIAATARQYRLPLATRNTKDFAYAGVKIMNPFH